MFVLARLTKSSPRSSAMSWMQATTLVFGTLISLLPMWAYSWPASLDWCQHVTVVDILVRLLRGDPVISQHFQLHVQPVGYYLFYALTVPLAFLFGAKRAVLLIMSLVLIGHVAVLAWALRRRQAPLLLSLVGVPAFYSAHFVWGFVVTLVATPFALATLLYLMESTDPSRQGKSQQGLMEGVLSLFAGLAHIIFVPLLLLAALATRVVGGRQSTRAVLGVAVGSSVVLMPAAISRGLGVIQGGHRDPALFAFTSVLRGLKRFSDIACSFDRSTALSGWLLLWAVLLVCIATPGENSKSSAALCERSCIALYAAICVAMVWVIPVDTGGSLGPSFLLNIRGLCLLPFLGALLASHSRLLRGPWQAPAILVALVLAVALNLVGVLSFGKLFARDADEWGRASAQLAAGSRLGVRTDRVNIKDEWPPVRLSMASMAFVDRLGWQNGVFMGGHLPIIERVPGSYARLETSVHRFVDTLLDKGRDDEAVEQVWQNCDTLFFQDPNIERWRPPEPDEAMVLATGRKWRLLGPPCSQRGDGESAVCGTQFSPAATPVSKEACF